MEKKNWQSLSITASAEAEEAVNFALNELGALGIELSTLGEKSPSTISITGYFESTIPSETVNHYLRSGLEIYQLDESAVTGAVWSKVEEQDWLAEWKKHWKPTESEKFIIAPPWENVSNLDKVVIKIEPNMAFGTGTHETTKLCLSAIETFYSPEMSFFDVGTGTGILAICAAKLADAETKIAGCDTDRDSVAIAKENAQFNSTPQVEFFEGSITQETPDHDFVCANVTADVIVPILPLLIEKSRKVLVLSGILATQEKMVTDELNVHGMKDFEVRLDGEWIGITVRMPIPF